MNFKNKLKLKIKTYKIVALALSTLLILMITSNIVLIKKIVQKKNTINILKVLATPALAQEIYPLFYCPCCGQPLDKDNICCGMAGQRIDYIDYLVQQTLSEDEIILSYVKKYGANSFMDKDKQKEFLQELVKQAPADRPIISLAPVTYDFGDVSQKRGIATTFFELKNEGNEDLIIDRLETSCGCTSVSIIYQGNEGPKFGMPGHGINEKVRNWQVVIPSGKTAQVKVYYDPYTHQDFRGFAIREIYVYSNDPIDWQKKVIIELNQVD